MKNRKFGEYFGFTNLMCKNPYLVMFLVFLDDTTPYLCHGLTRELMVRMFFWGEKNLVHGEKESSNSFQLGFLIDVIFDAKRWRCCL